MPKRYFLKNPLNRKKKIKRRSIRHNISLSYQKETKELNIKKVIILVFALLIIFLFLSGPKGLIRLLNVYSQKLKLEKEITILKESNQNVKKELRALKSDRPTIEKIAREELGLVKKGEVLYKFIKQKKTKPKSKTNKTLDNKKNQ